MQGLSQLQAGGPKVSPTQFGVISKKDRNFVGSLYLLIIEDHLFEAYLLRMKRGDLYSNRSFTRDRRHNPNRFGLEV